MTSIKSLSKKSTTTAILFFGLSQTALASEPIITITPASIAESVNTGTITPFTFTVRNNGPVKLYPTLLPSTTSSIQSVGGTCGTNGALPISHYPNNTCTIELTYTAPSSVPSINPAIASIVFGYGGRDNIPPVIGSFTLSTGALVPLTITHSLMFMNTNFGGNALLDSPIANLYYGTLTVTNPNSGSVTTAATPTSGITAVPEQTTCTGILGGNSSCNYTFSSAIPVSIPGSVAISATGLSTQTIPVAAISVTMLAPPEPTDGVPTPNAITLVSGCNVPSTTDPEAQLIEVTNNSTATVSNITAATTLTDTTITNPTFSQNVNTYCNGNILKEADSCEMSVSTSASAASTGTITINAVSGTEPVVINATVEAPINPSGIVTGYPLGTSSSEGGYIYISDGSCNLVDIVSTPDFGPPISWNNTSPVSGYGANSYCSSTQPNTSPTTFNDWRFPDVGPTPGDSTCSGSGCPPISGEFSVLFGGGTPVAGMSTSNVYWGPSINGDVDGNGNPSDIAWIVHFNDSDQDGSGKSNAFANLNVRCARAFTH